MSLFYVIIAVVALEFAIYGVFCTFDYRSSKKIVNDILDTIRLLIVGFDVLCIVSVVEHLA